MFTAPSTFLNVHDAGEVTCLEEREHPVAKSHEKTDKASGNREGQGATVLRDRSTLTSSKKRTVRVETRYYHIHESSISKSMSGSDGASGQRETIDPTRSLEECQCQGPMGPWATTKPVRSHVDHRRVLKQY